MKKILITGVSRGIGKATAETLLKRGYAVHGTYNSNQQAAEQLATLSDNLTLHQVDLSDYANIDTLERELDSTKLDGIVNSAGLFKEIDLKNFNIEDFEINFRVNAFAPLYLIQKLQTNLNDNSAIVNLSSTDAELGATAGLGYSASKAAVSNLTKSLALTLAPRGIRVNSIAPGWIGDGMQAPDELLKLASGYNPSGRLGTYQDIANIICYLLSDDAAYVNGASITADGGDIVKSYILEQETKML